MESLLKEYLKCRIPENSTEASRELETAAKKSEHLYFLRFDLNKTGNLRKALEKVEQLALNLYKTPWKRELYKLKEYGALIQNYLKPALSNYEDLLKVLGYEKQGHLYVLNIQKKMKKEKFSGNVKDYFLKVAIDLYILQVREPPNEVVKFSVKKYNTDNNTAHSSGSQIRGSDTGYSNRSVIPPSSSIGSKFHSQRHTDGNNLHSSSPDETDLYSSEDTGQVSSDISKKIESGHSQFGESESKIKHPPKDNINNSGNMNNKKYSNIDPHKSSSKPKEKPHQEYRNEATVKQKVETINYNNLNSAPIVKGPLPQHSVQERGRTQCKENNLNPVDAPIGKEPLPQMWENRNHSNIDGNQLKTILNLKEGDSELKVENTDHNSKMENASRKGEKVNNEARKDHFSSPQAETNDFKTSDTQQERVGHQNNATKVKELENVGMKSQMNIEDSSDLGNIIHNAKRVGFPSSEAEKHIKTHRNDKSQLEENKKQMDFKKVDKLIVKSKDHSASFSDDTSARSQLGIFTNNQSTHSQVPVKSNFTVYMTSKNRSDISSSGSSTVYVAESEFERTSSDSRSQHRTKRDDVTKSTPRTESTHSSTDPFLNTCNQCRKPGYQYYCNSCKKQFVYCTKCIKNKSKCSEGKGYWHDFSDFRTGTGTETGTETAV